jgi:PAS domain S-box-containing protein
MVLILSLGEKVVCRSLLFLAAMLGLCLLAVSQENPRFRRYSIEEGLSQSSVYAILQDARGFLWFATEDGLNRFDGYEFRIFRPDPESPDSLSCPYVTSLAEEAGRYLWAGTDSGGLNRFDIAAERFRHFDHDRDDPRSLSGNRITALLRDTQGRLWVGTWYGLDLFDPVSESFAHFRHDPADPASLSGNSVTALAEDSEGSVWVGAEDGSLNRLPKGENAFQRFPVGSSVRAVLAQAGSVWAGTEGGLVRLDAGTGRSRVFRHVPADSRTLASDQVEELFTDRNGHLWVGMREGLDRFDSGNQTFVHFRNDPSDALSLSDDSILSFGQDRSGGLWIGTLSGGLSRLDQVRTAFHLLRDRSPSPSRKARNAILSVMEDKAGTLWIGTDAGLHLLNRQTGHRSGYEHDSRDPGSLSFNSVRAIVQDRRGTTWVGTDGGGLDRLDSGARRFIHYRHDPSDPESLASDTIRFLLEGPGGEIWVATLGAGLDKLDPATGRFAHHRHESTNPESLSDDRVYTLSWGRDGFLWVGTRGGGLNRLDPATGRFLHFRTDPLNPSSLRDNDVMSLLEDRAGTLWAGTRTGLCRLDMRDRSRGRFTVYAGKEGLPNVTIYGLLEDEAGFLWLSHNRGLSRFDPRTGQVKNFGPGDGLQGLEFNGNSRFKSPSGEMFFGGINGLNAFFPGEIRDNPEIPPVAITGLQIFNRPVPVGPGPDGRVIIDRSPTAADAVHLGYRDNMITFSFAALHFSAPEDNQYAYKLEGFDRKWNEVGPRRLATYTNVRPGHYTFKVIASNNDGLWNERGASIAVIISPPFWGTLWFRVLAALAVLGAAVGAAGTRHLRVVRNRRELEAKVEERTAEISATNRRIQEEMAERRRAEEALRREKLNLDLLIDSAPEAIVVVDKNHRIARVNPEFSRLFGYGNEEVAGRPIDEVVASGDQRREAEGYTRKLGRGETIFFEGVRTGKGGRPVEVVGIGAPIQSGGEIQGHFAIYRDISDRRRAEEALRKRAAQAGIINRVGQRVGTTLEIGPLLEEIVDAVHETFGYYGVHLFLAEPNQNRLKLEAMAGGYKDVFPDGLTVDLGRGMIGTAALGGESQVSGDVRCDPHFVRLADEATQSELSVPIRGKDRLIGVLDIQSVELGAFDETDVAAIETLSTQIGSAIENARLYEAMQEELDLRLRMEKLLKDLTDDLARSNKELEQFAYVASHDLQEPLRMVGSYVQLLARRYRGRLDPDADAFINFAVDGASRMQDMINDLLAYSRVGTRGKPFAPTDCESALGRALGYLKLAISEKKAHVSHGPLPVVMADETQIIQLFQNLVGNAVKFHGPEPPEVHVSANQKNGEWEFAVRDNGIGIEPRYLERVFQIFERFHRDDRYPGTGIGLAICQRIVDRHGGRIWVESEPGRGSTFFFTIPRSAEVEPPRREG